jgi:hypothetical protein
MPVLEQQELAFVDHRRGDFGRRIARIAFGEGENTAREIALVWRRNSPRERDFRLLADLLRNATP